MARLRIDSRICYCGHLEDEHAEVCDMAGFTTWRCEGEGCDCEDFEEVADDE